jgi:endonuclease YncB( thermonuclease family)
MAGGGSGTERLLVRVTFVQDGDSFEAEHGGRTLTVRLHGVDAPERDQPFADAARALSSALLSGRIVALDVRDRDDYDRLVARVAVGSTDVNLALVEAGLAWHFTRFSNDSGLAAAERRARAAGRGLWEQTDPEPPWEFRASARGSETRRSSGATETGGYVGNARSHVFHRASCSNAGCSRCTERYSTRDEAVAAGHRPARCCRP